MTGKSKAIAVVEIILAIALVIGANVYDVVPISEVPWIFLLGWISLRLRGRGWKSVGLAKPSNWGKTIIIAAVAAIGLQLLSFLVIDLVVSRITGTKPDLSQFAPIIGNAKLLLVGLVLIWTLAAFGEELVYRAYLMNRVADLGDQSRAAWIASLLGVALLFGLAHLYQGVIGVVDTTMSGLYLGTLYLRFRRNLWIPILTHGFSDTFAILLVFFDLVPGLSRTAA